MKDGNKDESGIKMEQMYHKITLNIQDLNVASHKLDNILKSIKID
jgi:hypothetical protein